MTMDIDLKDSNLNKGIEIRLNKNSVKKKQKPIKVPLTDDQRKKRKITILLLSITFIILLGIGFLIYKGYIFSKELGFRLDTNSLTSSQKTELKKDSSGRYTNILLVGIDTRETGNLLNTDTIILASYNYETHDVTMISIPRDFYVEVDKDVKWYVKINSIYGSSETKEEGTGIEALKRSVERLTNQEIQYYAMVDFKAFVEIVDAVGGVDINVENSFTDYMYPSGNGYKTVSFNAGPQTMDGATALIYSRSRRSSQNNEGTDFARARRQQKVIVALKEKLMSNNSLSNPKTAMSIISSIAGNIKVSEFTIKDIEAAFELLKDFDKNEGKVYSFVLDPSVGGYSLVERKNMESGAYAIGPKLGLGNYKDIIEFIQLVKQYPQLYSENARVMVYNTGLGFNEAKEIATEITEKFPYLNIRFAGTLHQNKQGIAIYSKNEGYTKTIEELSNIINADSKEKPEYITSNLNGEDVTILLGQPIELTEEQSEI